MQDKNSKVKALIAHPGLAMTDLQNTTIVDGGMGAFMTGKMMSGGQTMEDGAIGIIKCIGDFYGPGSGKMDMKRPVVKFGLEEFYDNRKTKDLLWEKSCDAIGGDFII